MKRILISCLVIFGFSCKKGEIDVPPTVQSCAPTFISSSIWAMNGNISDPGTGCVSRGFIWGRNPSMMGVGNQTWLPVSGTSAGSFTANLSGLVSGNHYYYQAFAVGKVGTNYGTIVEIAP
ncbi:MAG: hypothetical protein ACJ77K_00090 [Bacteroidia bacterium]